MDKRQIQACVDYINKNARRLHGIEGSKETLADITTEDVVGARIQNGDEAVLVANRGIKGTPKYVLPLADVQKGTPPAKPEKPEGKTPAGSK